ncbi:ATP-binding protein [Imperialibacter sp. 75]|uniref:sensor histidine kinase n=2 Tax=Imperialibacter TaxID=1649461 RepID=UPI001918A117|nr:ATP-binding protein [Imperialibacter sp. 75]
MGFAMALVLLVITIFFSYRNMSQLRNVTLEVTHTHDVLFRIEEIYSQLLEIESNKRGFLLYHDQSFDEAKLAGIETIYLHLDTLRDLIGGNGAQTQRFDTLQRLISQRIALSQDIVNDSLAPRVPSRSTDYSLRGKRLTDAIKRIAGEMKNDERDLLNGKMRLVNASHRQFYQLYVAFGLVILLIFIFVVYIIRARVQERIATEDFLRRRSDEIKDLYDNAPCGYHSVDGDGNFIEINNTLLSWLGYSKDEVLHKMNFSDFLSENEKEVFLDNFDRFKAEGVASSVEFEMLRKDGTTFPIILNATAVYDGRGGFVKDRATIFDISLRKEAEDKARFLNAEMEAFSYSVSHDLRAPLRSIDSYTKIIAEEYRDKFDDEGQRLINTVLKNSARMARLIDDLLDFSRVGRKELIKSSFSMKLLVQSVLEEMEIGANDASKAINNQIDLDAWGDKSTLRQVWHNLISNAVKYSSKTPRTEIDFGSYADPSGHIFFIRDHGVGFDMAYYDKLFGVFQRLHSSREYDGTGVGLALTQRIVTKHGGEIWAESQPNQGSTFYFSLPLKD